MSKELKTLQERIEKQISDDLLKWLRQPEVMAKEVKLIDMFNYVSEYLVSWKDGIKHSEQMATLDNIYKANNNQKNRLLNIMFLRMYPEYYEKRINEMLKQLNP